MSATLPAESLRTWLEQHGQRAQSFVSEGRQFPYPNSVSTSCALTGLAAALLPAVREGLQLAQHGVLVFLPGQREIRRLAGELANEPAIASDASLWQLAAKSAASGIAAITERADSTARCAVKWCLATNIAETSVTIPDIDVVIDSVAERQRALLSALWYAHS